MRKKLESLSSIMFFTGSNSLNNALALENRQYGYEDENLGILSKTTSNDSTWSKIANETFVETTPKWKSLANLVEYTYTYINAKSEVKPINDMFIDGNSLINFEYNYEDNFNKDIENAKILPKSDVELFLQSINNSLYNKQKYYAKFNELDYITYNGIKYYWHKPGTELVETYTGTVHDIGNNFVTYEMNTHEVQSTIWNETTYTYDLAFKEVVDPETGETVLEPVMENKYSLKYLDSIYDIISNKLVENVDNFKSSHVWENEFDDNYSYNLYDLNNKISFIASTHSFGKTNIDVLLNYDGEFNNWFNNVITVNVDKVPSGKQISIIPGEDYWFNIKINKNENICGNSVFVNKGESHNFIINNDVNSPLSILSPYKINTLDLTDISEYLIDDLNLLSDYNKKINYKDHKLTNWDKEKSNLLEHLIIGKESVNCNITNIIGIDSLTNLKTINITGCNKLYNTPDISKLSNLVDFYAKDSNITVFNPAKNISLDNVILPDTINSILLDNVSINNFDYEPTSNLTTLDINNVSGFDSHNFVNIWINKLESDNLLNSGTVNYVNLKNVKWNDVQISLLEKLKQIELNEFTGILNIIGSYNEDKELSRNEYQLLYKLFGKDVFTENSDLKFKINLNDNAYKVNIDFKQKEIINEEEVLSDIDSIEATIIDSKSGNSFLDNLNDNIENVETSDFINNNRINIGIMFELENVLELDKKSENLEYLNAGDILLYEKTKLIIVSKTTKNINTNFIKIGEIEDTNKLTSILTSIDNIILSINSLE